MPATMKLQLLLLAAVSVIVLVDGISTGKVGKQVLTEAVASGGAMFAMMDSDEEASKVLEAESEEGDVKENKTPFDGTTRAVVPFYYIQSMQTLKVMEVENDQLDPFAHVVMFDYDGSTNQLWSYQDNMFYSQLNGLVMAISAETGNIITAVADGGLNQKWYFNSDYTIRSGTDSNTVMDVFGRDQGNGVWVISYPHSGDKNQHFQMVYKGEVEEP